MAAAGIATRILLLAAVGGLLLYALPATMIGRNAILKKNDSKTPTGADDVRACMDGSVTVLMGGRFGNRYMEYASAWAVARLYGLRLVLPATLRAALLTVFQSIPEPSILEFLQDRKTADGTPCLTRLPSEDPSLENVTAQNDIPAAARAGGPVVLPRYIVLTPSIIPLEGELRQHLRLRSDLLERSQSVLHKLGSATARDVGAQPHEVLFVGMHVRRTDYPAWLRKHARTNRTAGEGYYARALARLEEDLAREETDGAPPPLAVAIASDDMQWVREVLVPKLRGAANKRTRLHAAGGGTPEQDLALLAACNHTIIAYGTYGLTAALLAGGRTVAFRLHSSYPTSQIARALPNWEVLE